MMRVGHFILLLGILAGCGRDVASNTKSTYGKIDWLYTDQIEDLPKIALDAVNATVILSEHSYRPSKHGFCSGTLTTYRSLDVLLTAGHCIESQEACDDTYLIQNYQFGADGKLPRTYSVLKCDKLLFARLRGTTRDIAVATYRRFRVPHGTKVYKIPLIFGESKEDEPLVIASHPSSVDKRDVLDLLEDPDAKDEDFDFIYNAYAHSKQVSTNCKITNVQTYQVNHDCDTRSGSSGAGVFSLENGNFIGVHYLGGYNNYWNESLKPEEYNTAMNGKFVKRVLTHLHRKHSNRKKKNTRDY